MSQDSQFKGGVIKGELTRLTLTIIGNRANEDRVFHCIIDNGTLLPISGFMVIDAVIDNAFNARIFRGEYNNSQPKENK